MATDKSSNRPRIRKSPQKPESETKKKRSPRPQGEKEDQRRSFSQKNLSTKTNGQQGPRLLKALQVPHDPEKGYSLTHGFHAYPGRFHPNLAKNILQHEQLQGATVVFDPFMGGGTTLVEGMSLGLETIGNDLNPIAHLIADERCRLRKATDAQEVVKALNAIRTTVEEGQQTRKKLVNRKGLKWLKAYYPPHLFAEMIQFIVEIEKLPHSSTKDTLIAVFSALAVKFSNKLSDSSEEREEKPFPKGAVSRWMGLKTDELLTSQKSFYRKVPKQTKSPKLFLKDFSGFDALPEASVDVILTSPPYPGTYDYHNHHELRMRWLCFDDRPLKNHEIGTKRRHTARQWKEPFRGIMLKMRKLVKPNGVCYLVIGDWLDRNQPVSALDYVQKYAPSVGWKVESSASIQRKVYGKDLQEKYGETGKWEHLILLRRPPSLASQEE